MADGEGSKQISGDGALSEGNLYEGSYQDFKAEYGIESTGWAEAYSRDERESKPQRQSQPHTRSPQSRRATWRAKQSWNRTVARTRQVVDSRVSHWPSDSSRFPTAKGFEDTKVWAWLKRLFNLNW